MTTKELTPEAVAKHAAAWPAPKPSATGEPVGMWRVNFDDGHPLLVGLFVNRQNYGVYAVAQGFGGRTEWSAPLALGTWTPVRPDGSDLPTNDWQTGYNAGHADGTALVKSSCAEAYERGRVDGRVAEWAAIRTMADSYFASEPPGRQGEAFRRFLVALASPGMGGPAGEPDPVPPNCIHLDHATAIAQARHAYDNAYHGRIGDQRAFAEGLLAPVVRALEEAEHTINRAMLLVPAWAPEHCGDIEQAVRGLVEMLVYERDERFRLGGEIQHALTMLERHLGERPASVVDGVRALSEALRMHADEMACQLHEAEERGRAEGRAEERARLLDGVEAMPIIQEAITRAHVCGRAEERAAIVVGLDKEIASVQERRSYKGPTESALAVVRSKINAGEWSAKP